MAEGRGFEPREAIKPRWFSKPVLSTTQPPLPIVFVYRGNLRIKFKRYN